eukprot:1147417-Pelagomonas_calceolata.AAC.3
MHKSNKFASKVCALRASSGPEKFGGFSNLLQMTRTPEFKLLLGRLIILGCQILRGGTGGACWWGDPSGQVCKPMQDKRHRIATTASPGDLRTSTDVAKHNAFIRI